LPCSTKEFRCDVSELERHAEDELVAVAVEELDELGDEDVEDELLLAIFALA